jgi:hypothetical protein
MSKEQDLILSVVEELKGLQLVHFLPHIYKPEFWLPHIPLRSKKLTEVGDKQYEFMASDVFSLDPLGTIKKDVILEGTINVVDYGAQGDKGNLWELQIDVKKPVSKASIRLRAKNVGSNLKVGIYVYELELDLGALEGFGRDGVLFAARVKLRDFMQQIQKHLVKMI